jgi:Zn-dependent alcohol dehydrogenase
VAGICGAQLHEIAGHRDNEKFLPHMMGHEGGGIVREVGPGVTKVIPGDRVVMHWRKGSGIEAPFVKYGKVGAGKVTTFSEQTVVSENRVTKLPSAAPFELCALLGCGITTAFSVINNDAKLRMGESVLVLGCGGVGLSIIKGASLVGGSPICGFDKRDKYDMAIIHGAHNFYHNWNLINDSFDAIIDTVGSPELFGKAINKLAPSGRYIMVGQPKPGEDLPITNAIRMFEGTGKKILATQGGQGDPDVDIPRYYRMYANKVFDFNDLITHRYELDQVNEAITTVRDGYAGRVLLNI